MFDFKVGLLLVWRACATFTGFASSAHLLDSRETMTIPGDKLVSKIEHLTKDWKSRNSARPWTVPQNTEDIRYRIGTCGQPTPGIKELDGCRAVRCGDGKLPGEQGELARHDAYLTASFLANHPLSNGSTESAFFVVQKG